MHVNGRDLNSKYLFVSPVLMGRLFANIKFFQWKVEEETEKRTWQLVEILYQPTKLFYYNPYYTYYMLYAYKRNLLTSFVFFRFLPILPTVRLHPL